MSASSTGTPATPAEHADRAAQLHARLSALSPTHLEVIDESHLHAGHAGSRAGASHFRVVIAAPQFASLRPVARHRLVYDLVKDLMPHPIHALAIDARVLP